MNTDYTDATLVLDRSGSMAQIRNDMEGVTKTFVEEQAKLPGKCLLSVLQFDSNAIEWLFQGKPIEQVSHIPPKPRGATPLLDALGKAIRETGQRLAAMDQAERPGRVLLVVITDGLENASREVNVDQV
jgi:Mg-chelatase subunit ChlD